MFTIESILEEHYPAHKIAEWQLSILKRVLHEKEFHDFDKHYRHLKGLDMVEQVFEYFDIRCDTSERDLEHIPTSGPVVIVANHPSGTLDGLALLHTVSQVRRDVKIVTNSWLSYLKALNNLTLTVDNMGNRTSRQQIELMQEHLNNQGALVFFPSGEVSRFSSRGVRDGKWNQGVIRIAARSRAPIVPIHISSRNSTLFYAASAIYQPLSTLMLVHEMFRQQGSRIKLQIGAHIPFAHWHDGRTPAKELAARFREHAYRIVQKKSGLFQTEAPIALARKIAGN